MSDPPTLTEGDEEMQYVFVSLPPDLDPIAFGPGSVVTIEGLATDAPVLRPNIIQPSSSTQAAAAGTTGAPGSSSSSSALQGQYVDNLGSILFMREQPTATHNAKPSYAFVGHTDKQLQFTKPS